MTTKQRGITFSTILVFAVLLTVAASHAQQKSTPVKLNAEASKMIDAIEADKKACLDAANRQEGLILIGAGVQRDAQCSKDTDGLWTCTKPEAAQSPSPPVVKTP
jgi:hypothetical protein